MIIPVMLRHYDLREFYRITKELTYEERWRNKHLLTSKRTKPQKKKSKSKGKRR